MLILGFGAQANATPGAMPGGRTAGNGLLNALSANSRATDARSPDAVGVAGMRLPFRSFQDDAEVLTLGNARPQDLRGVSGADEPRQKPPGFQDDGLASQASGKGLAQMAEGRNPLGAIGSNEASGSKPKGDLEGQPPATNDPLAGMAPIDKWGIKGLRTLMHNYPDYNAAVTGMEPSQFGLDVSSHTYVVLLCLTLGCSMYGTDHVSRTISAQIFSLFSEVPPRPAIPEFKLPECYSVNNVQPLENKISSFNEETLMWIFYTCCGDTKQKLAATEL